ncbi:glycerophosphodiester phosphodiesterase [Legionella sp. W05-934-2]|jgi:glycerophosphoryl diester phosphodiesterase|uniref:glycerophosphodiester phosphodiesterase n=1 Tax=Legionella sp. W05-934-2 TaxID=1198649 RepID=UPI003461A4F4
MIETLIAHRGASGYAPENTIAAFDKALALGCLMIEFDVMLSQDGEPFVFHDDKLKRTTNGRGEIGQVTAEYLQSLDAGKWFHRQFKGEKIPHLKDALKWLSLTNMKANIEIKPYPGTTEETTMVVLTHINRHWPHNRSLPLVSSFDYEALLCARSISPELPLGLLMHEWDDNWQQKADYLSAYSVHLHYKIATRAHVTSIKEKGYAVAVYTVNRKRLANKLLSWGVDGLFTDYPDLL